MANVLLINARAYETRIALLENSQCVELHVERKLHCWSQGNIYLGRVARVLPGMQAAFVDIGLAKAAFLYVNDVREYSETDAQAAEIHAAKIEDLLSEGQDILVQVAKGPLGNKGARITSHITLPGRNLVLMPTIDSIGISRRITDEQERARLREVLAEIRPPGWGLIARTESEGQQADKLKAELDFLASLWDSVNQKRQMAQAPQLLHQDLSVSLRAVRDLFTREIDRLIIDSPTEYEQVREFVAIFVPRLLPCLELYQGKEPIFDAYGVEPEINRALTSKVWLKSGGYIVIQKTEALTSIDVNTGRYVGGHNLEDTILKTNLEAVREIACQLRLRDIGGLIVIDFIDMEREGNQEKIVSSLKEALVRDRSRTNVLGMSALGLVEMTRKRVRGSLAEQLNSACPYCSGEGTVKSLSTVCAEILRSLERENARKHEPVWLVNAHPLVAEKLLQDEAGGLEELERQWELMVQVKADGALHQEEFEIVSLRHN